MAKISIGYAGDKTDFGGLNASKTLQVEFDIPKTGSAEFLEVLKRDCELLLDAIDKNPDAVEGAITAASSGDMQEATKCCDVAGLDEDRFISEGGGWLHIAAVIAVGTVVRMWPRTAHAPTE